MHGSNSVSYKEETDGSGKFHVIVNVESNVPGPSEAASIMSQHGCNGESQQHYEQQLENRKSTYSDEQPLAHSPAPQTEKENEHDSFRDGEARDKADYDHLQPSTAKDDGDIKDEHQYAELEEPIAKRSKTPPKKPPRLLQSREHLYHTLENSDESGLLRSADTSHGGSQLSGMNDYAEANILPTGAFISSQVQEIFDDPRYAAVFVNQDHLEHTHIHDKIEVSRSRSTPSLVAVDIIPFSPSDTGRRSLRVVRQKRPSILNSHFVPHH